MGQERVAFSSTSLLVPRRDFFLDYCAGEETFVAFAVVDNP